MERLQQDDDRSLREISVWKRGINGRKTFENLYEILLSHNPTQNKIIGQKVEHMLSKRRDDNSRS